MKGCILAFLNMLSIAKVFLDKSIAIYRKHGFDKLSDDLQRYSDSLSEELVTDEDQIKTQRGNEEIV